MEGEICQFEHEVGVVFDKNGNDVTHNHPLSIPPSPEDLYLLVNYQYKPFRTTGKNGTYVLNYSEEVVS